MIRIHIRKVLPIVIGSIIPTLMILIIYEKTVNWTYDFDIIELLQPIGYILLSVVTYYGMITFVKPLLSSFNFYTKNKFIIRIITIFITISGLVIVLQLLSIYDTGLNLNDQGLILEIIGFFIYLNPINLYITNFLTEEHDEEIDHKLIIKTTAIGLVLFGLILQFSRL